MAVYRISHKIKNVEEGILYYYDLDFVKLLNFIETKRISKGPELSNNELELPYLLYKTFHYYEAYNIYKYLASKYWLSKKYILYFLCQKNIKSISNLLIEDDSMPIETRIKISNRIIEEANKIDLNDILNNIKFDKRVIYELLEKIDDFRIIYEDIYDVDKLYQDIKETSNIAKKGGFAWNSHVQNLVETVFSLFNLCNNNYIAFEHYIDHKFLYKKAFEGIVISNNIQQDEQKRTSKLKEIHPFHLWLAIFNFNTKELEKIFLDNEVKEISLSNESIIYIQKAHLNIKSSIPVLTEYKGRNLGNHFHSLISNFLFLTLKSNCSKYIKVEILKTIIESDIDFSKLDKALIIAVNTLEVEEKNFYTVFLDKLLSNKMYPTILINLLATLIHKIEKSELQSLLNNNFERYFVRHLDFYSDYQFIYLVGTTYNFLESKNKDIINDYIESSLSSSYKESLFRIIYDSNIPVSKNHIDRFIQSMESYFSNKRSKSSEERFYELTLFNIYRKGNSSLKERIRKITRNSTFLKFLFDLEYEGYSKLIDPNWMFSLSEEQLKKALRNKTLRAEIKEAVLTDPKKFKRIIAML